MQHAALKTAIHSMGEVQSGTRIKIVGILIGKNANGTIIVDDGTGQARTKFFSDVMAQKAAGIDVGLPVMVIGGVSEFDGQKYVAGDIIKKVDNELWMRVHQREALPRLKEDAHATNTSEPEDREAKIEKGQSRSEKIINLIREGDKGEGVLVEELIEKVGGEKTDKIIEKLLQDGEIFEVAPGKVKILE
jgi:RPA family protein